MDWKRFFDAAGLDVEHVHAGAVAVGAERLRRRAQGVGRTDAGTPGHHAARGSRGAIAGRPAFFQVVGPWTRRPRMRQTQDAGRPRVIRFGLFLIVFGAVRSARCVLARHNLQNGRGDRRGATRVALFVLVVDVASWVLGARILAGAAHRVQPLPRETSPAAQLLDAAILWLIYLALEPYVRRY